MNTSEYTEHQINIKKINEQKDRMDESRLNSYQKVVHNDSEERRQRENTLSNWKLSKLISK